MRKAHRPRTTTEGFTLLEMVVVLAIISIILGGAVGVIRGIINSAREDQVRTDFRTMEVMLLKYQITSDSFPTSEQGLDALVAKPTRGPIPRRWSQVVDELPLDPWGSEFEYRYPGSKKPQDFELVSAGKDRIRGTGDDMSSQDD